MRVPAGGFVGLSASTGELSDNHDVLALTLTALPDGDVASLEQQLSQVSSALHAIPRGVSTSTHHTRAVWFPGRATQRQPRVRKQARACPALRGSVRLPPELVLVRSVLPQRQVPASCPLRK